MVRKPELRQEFREVFYSVEHWALLERLRQKAIRVMEVLQKAHLETFVHGSLARGDVTQKSDIDIFIGHQVSSFSVQTALERAQLPINRRLVVQATPMYALKAYIEIGKDTVISFPLMKTRKVEREFYRFGGQASLTDLRNDLRIVGVDKRLMHIKPLAYGHEESSIIGREELIAKLLGISVQTVLDRVHALLRRDEIGRTGVFIERELSEDETFEMMLQRLVDKNPSVRRRLRTG